MGLSELVVGGHAEAGSHVAGDIARCANGLARLGVRAGDRVAILMRNAREQLVATVAAQDIGAYPVQMNWHAQASELHYILADCTPRVLVAHSDLLQGLDAGGLAGIRVVAVTPSHARPGTNAGDSAAMSLRWDEWMAGQDTVAPPPSPAVESIIYTSGTTGRPKGVRRFAPTEAQHRLTEQLRLRMTGIDAASRVLVPAPLYHTAPHMFALRALRKASLLVVQERFDPLEVLRAVEHHRITHLYAVPTMFVRLLALPDGDRRRHHMGSLQFVLSAGGPCAPAVKRAMIDWWGPVINEYYGSTEAGPCTFCTSEDALRRPGTIGKALDGVALLALDEEGRPVPPGTAGELHVRSEAYPDFTYINREQDRAELQRGGLMATGDVGYRDGEGYFFLCDRKRDLVISGGVNIYPAEIEAMLLELPGVADCAVFGIPDEEFGEALAALVEPHAGQLLDTAAVLAHLQARLPSFKVPRLVEVRERLPRDEAGKLRKRVLREPYWQGAGRRI